MSRLTSLHATTSLDEALAIISNVAQNTEIVHEHDCYTETRNSAIAHKELIVRRCLE